ncbi:M10 family metallopeptidase C-terminal domain-containing protein [Rhizobium sp. ARZ01]|nr:M10 family metallopeptidase C-terminal domain-containing protein [Rhizobium sp. ARZ01]
MGGAGADTFVFKAKAESISTARDTIYDFSSKQGDRIDLSGFDAYEAKAGIQDFNFIGTKGFSGKAGELRYETKANDSYVYADTNRDKKADFVLHFDDKISFVTGDFLF